MSSQAQPESTRFRHRGPLSREQAERAIERASDVRIVLQILTRYARQFVDLSVVFVVRRGVATARESDGWTYEPVHVELGAGGTLGDVSESQTARLARFEPLGVDATVRDALGVEDHAVVVVPLTIRGRTVALFLGADRDADVEEEVVDEIRDFSQRVAGALARIIIETKKKG